MTTNRLEQTLAGPGGSQVLALAISPDDRTLTTGHSGGALKVWDMATGRERAALKGHRFSPRSLAFFPDGQTLASGSVDGTVRIWDLAIGQTRATLKVPGGTILALAVSPDGDVLATVAADGSVRLWSAGRHEWNEPADSTVMSDLEKLGDAHTLVLANNLAWALAVCPDSRLRNPRRAVALAQAAVRAKPRDVRFHNTLGVAHYRVGDWDQGLGRARAIDRAPQRRRRLRLVLPGDGLLAARRTRSSQDLARKKPRIGWTRTRQESRARPLSLRGQGPDRRSRKRVVAAVRTPTAPDHGIGISVNSKGTVTLARVSV